MRKDQIEPFFATLRAAGFLAALVRGADFPFFAATVFFAADLPAAFFAAAFFLGASAFAFFFTTRRRAPRAVLANPAGRCALRRRCRAGARRAGAAAGAAGTCNTAFNRLVISSTSPSAGIDRNSPCAE